jgi:CheY-like chemotaxis protein
MEQHSNALRVMVIDDSKTIRRTAETLLKNAGCEVITAIDGFDALARIVDHHPHIIFVDIMMPRLDGYQTCALYRRCRSVFDQAVQQGRTAGCDQGLCACLRRSRTSTLTPPHKGRRPPM